MKLKYNKLLSNFKYKTIFKYKYIIFFYNKNNIINFLKINKNYKYYFLKNLSILNLKKKNFSFIIIVEQDIKKFINLYTNIQIFNIFIKINKFLYLSKKIKYIYTLNIILYYLIFYIYKIYFSFSIILNWKKK